MEYLLLALSQLLLFQTSSGYRYLNFRSSHLGCAPFYFAREGGAPFLLLTEMLPGYRVDQHWWVIERTEVQP
jgi:hypothetical protein